MMSMAKVLEVSIYLILTLAAITGLALLVRFALQRRGYVFAAPSQPRLKVTERLQIDHRRQVIRLQDQDKSYLLLLGATNEVLLNAEKINQDA